MLDQCSLLAPTIDATSVGDLLETMTKQELSELVGDGTDHRLLLTGQSLNDEQAAWNSGLMASSISAQT